MDYAVANSMGSCWAGLRRRNRSLCRVLVIYIRLPGLHETAILVDMSASAVHSTISTCAPDLQMGFKGPWMIYESYEDPK